MHFTSVFAVTIMDGNKFPHVSTQSIDGSILNLIGKLLSHLEPFVATDGDILDTAYLQ